MVVPGGCEAVERLLGGLDPERSGFAVSLNRVLIQHRHEGDEWRAVAARRVLSAHLGLVEDLNEAWTFPLELHGAEGRSLLEDLSARLGFRLMRDRGRLDLVPLGGLDSALARRSARALGWDLPVIADTLMRGERVALELSDDLVDPLMPLALQARVRRDSVAPEEAMEIMVFDQRLGLVAEGLRRLDKRTRASFDDERIIWLYDNAAQEFLRLAGSLQLGDSGLALPGGREASRAWSRLVGAPADDPWRFIRALLTSMEGRALDAWIGLRYSRGEHVLPFLEKLLDAASLREPAPSAPFRRFFPPGHFDLGKPGRWGSGLLHAARVAGRPGGSSYLLALPDLSRVERGPRDLSAHVRVAGVIDEHPELRETGFPRALASMARNMPEAFRFLERFRGTDPSSLRLYARAVSKMELLSRAGVSGESAALDFQGGCELLRILDQRGHASPRLIEERFLRWVQLHTEGSRDQVPVGAKIRWLAELARRLPEPNAGAAGRGPLEQRLLTALTLGADPQRFRLAKLDFQGHRSRDEVRLMEAWLVEQRIPSLDQLVGVAEALVAASEARDASAARALRRAKLTLDAFPRPVFDPPLEGSAKERFGIEERESLGKELGRRLSNRHSRLGRREVRNAIEKLASDLRALLVMPVYLEALGVKRDVLLDEPNLVRKHWISVDLDSQRWREPGDSPWSEAALIASPLSTAGGRIGGHLGGVTRALSRKRQASATAGLGNVRRVEGREESWFEDLETTRWRAITRPVSRAISALIDAGGELAAKSDDPKARALLERSVPRARLERGGKRLVSMAERLDAGLACWRERSCLAWLRQDTRKRVTSTMGALGDDPLVWMNAAGRPTPATDGRLEVRLGPHYPYESLEADQGNEALLERSSIDLRLRIVAYLGRRGLPGEVGRDLLLEVLEEMPRSSRIEGRGDWEGFVIWVNEIEDEHLDERMRECLRAGVYRLYY